jgi:hypothetical protein
MIVGFTPMKFDERSEPRKRAEQALVAVVQQAYAGAVTTRKVDQVVESLGLRISRTSSRGSTPGSTSRSMPSAAGRSSRYQYCGWPPRSRMSETATRSCRRSLMLAYAVRS